MINEFVAKHGIREEDRDKFEPEEQNYLTKQW